MSILEFALGQLIMWLSTEILDWHFETQFTSVHDKVLRLRSYQIWTHAQQVLDQPSTDFLRVDAITTLKRAIDHRIRLLDVLYSFRKIPIKDKPSETLNLLGFVGVVRPSMLQKLIDIRNLVEHEDASPPNHEECRMFLEFTWYFLRSTDMISSSVVTDFVLRHMNELDSDYWLDFEFGPESDWVPKFFGWVPANMLSTTPIDSWMALLVSRVETREEALVRLSERGSKSVNEESGRGRNPNDFCIHGEVRGPGESIAKLSRIYFAAS